MQLILSVQQAIAHILGTLDDKIELNQKINQTLEEIAKAIFKSWFVDFDPVRAKAEGRPTGLPPEISDLFPDELVDSEIGEIPKGWELLPFRNVKLKWNLGEDAKVESTNRLDWKTPIWVGGIDCSSSQIRYRLWEKIRTEKRQNLDVGRKRWRKFCLGSQDEPFFPIDTTFYVRTEEQSA